MLTSFPLRLDCDHRNRSLLVSGIEPSQVDIAPVIGALGEAAAPYRIINRIGIVPGLDQTTALQAGVTALQQSLPARRPGSTRRAGQ